MTCSYIVSLTRIGFNSRVVTSIRLNCVIFVPVSFDRHMTHSEVISDLAIRRWFTAWDDANRVKFERQICMCNRNHVIYLILADSLAFFARLRSSMRQNHAIFLFFLLFREINQPNANASDVRECWEIITPNGGPKFFCSISYFRCRYGSTVFIIPIKRENRALPNSLDCESKIVFTHVVRTARCFIICLNSQWMDNCKSSFISLLLSFASQFDVNSSACGRIWIMIFLVERKLKYARENEFSFFSYGNMVRFRCTYLYI